MLKNKNAIIYGGGGSIGGAIARTFARHGATVHLAGRTRETLEAVAADITASGGRAEVAVVDALDEKAVEDHARHVIDSSGSLDVSLNLASRGDVHGTPLTDITAEDFLHPITTGITTNFITARTAARHMSEQGSGVILTLNSGSAKGSPMMGGTGPADAAIDTLVRNLAQEVGPSGVRVIGIWTAGLSETLTRRRLAGHGLDMDDAAFESLLNQLNEMRMLRRSPTLAQIADTAAFLASDGAAAITATFVNATSGIFAD
ncbi:NADP-dependent 3-hydroxy acid dehydrogenase YdfG [Actinomadura pelletieri DSM 43383]|uniref:NADP-dependent 3-hydroxy acid dehydrogenase YdfG n=1 Tax=Actinomadura pelletieri DSM 43383 TaxID=1120940 RepID=A0A495QJ09_9ACTN|nr:SDR family oxidoreductase [Actinomadura pelletieri]RKS72118.1 NADP-dependent 3-hydroxy acid dehydrogenase YdfG [Actinomadura pelletieri DSM 43383]